MADTTMTTSRRRLAAFTIAVACAAQSLPARQARPADPQQPPVTFKVEVNYVEIDATVVDAQGNPMLDLGREDFQILEDGRPQALTVFSRVEIPLERPDPPLFRAAVVEPDVRSNRRQVDGRVFVLLLDDLHTSFTRTGRLRAAVTQFIERFLGENDVAAVVQTGGGVSGAQEFTGSRALLLRAVNGFAGRKLPSGALEKMRESSFRSAAGVPGPARDPYDAERAHKARSLLTSLKGVAEYLNGVRGRRKAVVLFSEGIDYDITNPIQNRYASDIMAELRAAVAAATRANVSFYTVDPRGLSGFEDFVDMPAPPADDPGAITSVFDETRLSQDSLRILADETGGIAAVNRNDFRDAFQRIIRDNSSYYVLGYYSNNPRRDGRFRAVDVKVSRPGAVVRARKGYTAPRGDPPAARTRVAAGTSPELREALNSPVPVSGLGLTASAVPYRYSDKASVLLTVEIDGSGLQFIEKEGRLSEDIEIVVVPYDPGGTVHEGVRDKVTMTPRPQTRDIIVARGVRVLRRLELKSGRYQLRVGAREAGAGKTGSVVLDLDVPDFAKGPLTMSGLLLTARSAELVPTPRPDELLKGIVPGPPTVSRDFSRDDELTVFAEIYDNLRPGHRVAIKTTATADDGTVVFGHTDERGSDELRARGDGFGHLRQIPLKEFTPGRYVLRVEARALVSDGAGVARELEFRVR
jgi:VWFA-related protein